MRIGTLAGAMIVAMALDQPVSAGVTPTSKVVVAGTGCPGGLRADQHAVSGQRTIWTIALEDNYKKDKKDKKDEWPSQGSMGVHVVFQGARNQTQSLEFSVSYLPVELRLTPVAPAAEGKNPPEMKKHFALTTHDKTRVDGDLMVGPAATITRVHLISATFADGSIWHAASEGACSVEPNRVIAIDGKESSLRW